MWITMMYHEIDQQIDHFVSGIVLRLRIEFDDAHEYEDRVTDTFLSNLSPSTRPSVP